MIEYLQTWEVYDWVQAIVAILSGLAFLLGRAKDEPPQAKPENGNVVNMVGRIRRRIQL